MARDLLLAETVSSLHARLSSIALVAAMLMGGAAPVFASDLTDAACLSHHHDCSQAAQVKGCCCLEPGDSPDEATPAAVKTQIVQPVADDAMVLNSEPVVRPGLLRHARAMTIAPRSSPPDLITLFGALLL